LSFLCGVGESNSSNFVQGSGKPLSAFAKVKIYLTHQIHLCYLFVIMRNEKEPTTLQEAMTYFDDPDNCLNYLVARRWQMALSAQLAALKT